MPAFWYRFLRASAQAIYHNPQDRLRHAEEVGIRVAAPAAHFRRYQLWGKSGKMRDSDYSASHCSATDVHSLRNPAR
jgi:hypothetical protein